MQTLIIKIESISPAESVDNLKERATEMLEESELVEYLSYPAYTIEVIQD